MKTEKDHGLKELKKVDAHPQGLSNKGRFYELQSTLILHCISLCLDPGRIWSVESNMVMKKTLWKTGSDKKEKGMKEWNASVFNANWANFFSQALERIFAKHYSSS